jgi:hypothetical protein
MARLASLRRLLAAWAAELSPTKIKIPTTANRATTTAIINSRLDNRLEPVRAVLWWVSVTDEPEPAPESSAMKNCLVFGKRRAATFVPSERAAGVVRVLGPFARRHSVDLT